MTEYELFGVLFFGSLFLVLVVAGIVDVIQSRRFKKRIKTLRRLHRKAQHLQEYAEFIAFAERG